MYPALRLQYQTSRNVAELRAQYDTLRKRNETLRGEVAGLKTPAGIELAARSSLGLTRRGENLVVVLPADGAASTTATGAVSGGGSDVVTSVLDAIFGVDR